MRNFRLAALLVFLSPSASVLASDETNIAKMLDEFLAGASVGSVEAHKRFWADELVYTSSAGARTNKAEILVRMREAVETNPAEPEVVYTADIASESGELRYL